jgi:hypothetical protein
LREFALAIHFGASAPSAGSAVAVTTAFAFAFDAAGCAVELDAV